MDIKLKLMEMAILNHIEKMLAKDPVDIEIAEKYLQTIESLYYEQVEKEKR